MPCVFLHHYEYSQRCKGAVIRRTGEGERPPRRVESKKQQDGSKINILNEKNEFLNLASFKLLIQRKESKWIIEIVLTSL
jgi:hypothetical protein